MKKKSYCKNLNIGNKYKMEKIDTLKKNFYDKEFKYMVLSIKKTLIKPRKQR